MADFLKPLGLAALIALASPVLAQDAAETPAEDAVPAEEPALDMGSPEAGAEAAPTQVQTYVDEQFGDWSRECLRLPEGQEGDDPCQITQVLRTKPEENPIGKISIGKLPEGGQAMAGSMIILPLGTLLTQQITIGVDSGAAKRYPFRYCDKVGCVAQIGFTAAEVTSLKAGNQATITITPATAPEARVAIPVSLSGFTAAWDSLATPAAAAQ